LENLEILDKPFKGKYIFFYFFFPYFFFPMLPYTENLMCMSLILQGKYVNGTTLVVDGGQWLSQPRYLPKEAVKQVSRVVERRSRAAPTGVPKSKL
jgi:hypothetical protein